MDCLKFQSLIGILESFVRKPRSNRHCIHGYSFQSLIGILGNLMALLPLMILAQNSLFDIATPKRG